jgi:N-acetylglucosaminyl-diphospho-decaprenol L-rhamnosyltransferase
MHLLHDLDALDGIERWAVLITLNLPTDHIDTSGFTRLNPVIIRNNVPAGFGANHNAAFARASGTWFVVLNPDIRISDPQTLQRIANPAPGTALALRAPIVRNSAGALEDSVRRNLTPLDLWRRRRQPPGTVTAASPHQFYWVAGMFMIFDRTVFAALHGFDERFFLYCEDYDICARATIYGHGVRLIDDLTVIHDAQRDSHRSRKYLRWHLQSLIKVWTSAVFWRVLLRRDPN